MLSPGQDTILPLFPSGFSCCFRPLPAAPLKHFTCYPNFARNCSTSPKQRLFLYFSLSFFLLLRYPPPLSRTQSSHLYFLFPRSFPPGLPPRITARSFIDFFLIFQFSTAFLLSCFSSYPPTAFPAGFRPPLSFPLPAFPNPANDFSPHLPPVLTLKPRAAFYGLSAFLPLLLRPRKIRFKTSPPTG